MTYRLQTAPQQRCCEVAAMFNTTSLSASDRESGHHFDRSVFKIVVVVWHKRE